MVDRIFAAARVAIIALCAPAYAVAAETPAAYLAAKDAIIEADSETLSSIVTGDPDILMVRDDRSRLLMHHALKISYMDEDANIRSKTNFQAIDVMLMDEVPYGAAEYRSFADQSQSVLNSINRYVGRHSDLLLEPLPMDRNQYVRNFYFLNQLAAKAGSELSADQLLKVLLAVCDTKAIRRVGQVPPDATLTRAFQTAAFGDRGYYPTIWVKAGMIEKTCAVTLIKGRG